MPDPGLEGRGLSPSGLRVQGAPGASALKVQGGGAGEAMRGMRVRGGAWACVVAGLLAGCADRERSTLADGQLAMEPRGVDFHRVALYDTPERELVLRNVGRVPLDVNEAWVEGPAGTWQARVEQPCRLLPGERCRLWVRFSPLQAMAHQAVLVVRTDTLREPELRVPLSGVGVDARARLSPPRLDFGRIEANSSKALPLSLENPSDLEVVVTPRVVGVDQDEFSAAPVVLAPGERLELTLTFAPERVGRKQAGLEVEPCRNCPHEPVQVEAVALDRAVVAEPPVLDFGSLPVDQQRERVLRVRNISTEPMRVEGLALGRVNASFQLLATPALPRVLQPDETIDVPARYSPGHMGAAGDEAVFRVLSRRNPTTPVELRGHGGAAELCISPSTHDFGHLPLGAKVSVRVSVRNCGAANAGPLTVQELRLEPQGGGELQFTLPPLPLPVRLASGESLTLNVAYEPTLVGPAQALLRVVTDVYTGQHGLVRLHGQADLHGPCELHITPREVDFGTVVPGRGAVLGVKVENRGREVCPVKNIRLSRDGGGVFSLPGGELDGGVVWPHTWFSLMVAFHAPAAGGSFTGELQIEAAQAGEPLIRVPLRAHSQASCLVAAPPFLDYGVARTDCPPAGRRIQVLNGCAAPVEVGSVAIGPGTTDGEFALGSVPALPLTLPPGAAFSLEVDYFARVYGMNLSPLYVAASDLPAPLLVPLVGEGSRSGDRTDTFVQQDSRKVDVLFVVDNTASMVEEQPRFIDALPAFAQAALSRGVDLHVAVTTTGLVPESPLCPGGAQGGEAGRLFPVNGSRPRLLTHETPELAARLQENATVGLCATVEQGLEAVRRALSPPLVDSADDPRTPEPADGNLGFLREEAALVVVFVGDEDDHSPDDVDTYVRFLWARKGAQQPQRVTVYAIAPTARGCATSGGAGTRYAEVAQRTGGEVLSVCEPDYTPLLRAVASRVFSAQHRFPLAERPEPGSLRVQVNGAPASGWTYEPSANNILFTQVPAPGAHVEVQYRLTCQ
jgi:hypothetical protein